MTITAQTAKTGPYTGNGSTTSFDYTFRVDAEADIVVTVLNAAGTTETVKTLTTDYTVSGVGNAAGGSITMLVAPATGEKLTITRSVQIDQEIDLQNRGAVNPETLEQGLDKLTQIAQDQQQQLDRSLKVDLFETADLATLTTNVNAVAAIASDVSTVAGVAPNVTTVAGISANVTTVAGISANVTTVAGVAADVTTTATNIAAVIDAPAQATAAAAFASAAATSETNAAGSASAAASSASAAASSASAAATSETNAAASASAAAASAASIDPATLLTKAGNLSGIVDPAAARSNIGAAALSVAQTFGAGQRGNTQTASITGSTTLDFATYQNFVLTLTGNVTLDNPTTEVVGQSGFIVFVQDGTGGRTVSLGSDFITAGGAGVTLSAAASAIDVVPYIVSASNQIILGTPQLAFS